MGFSLFGSSGDNKTTTETNTSVTDASASAAEGATALSGGSSLVVNSVAPEITQQAFNTVGAVAGKSLDTGLNALQVSANLVPDLLKSQAQQSQDVLKASQENANLAQQFASIGAAGARSASTAGASTILEGPVPYIVGAIVLGALLIYARKK